MAAVIEVRDVVNRFGKQLVHDGVSLTLNQGEILGIAGGSGSGKSVLMRTILGLNRPASGTVRVAGKDVLNLSDEDRREMAMKWGVMFQEGALFSNLTVLENIAVPLREYTELPEEDIASLAAYKMELVGLEPGAGAKAPSALSGGMTRRASLARALALDPEILFLDELTSGLDPVTAAASDDLILDLRRILDISVLVITHDLDTLVNVCDRVAMLVDKKIVCGTVGELMASDNPKIQQFFCGPRMHDDMRDKARAEA